MTSKDQEFNSSLESSDSSVRASDEQYCEGVAALPSPSVITSTEVPTATTSGHEFEVFRKFYSKFKNLDLEKLTAYFVGKEIIDFEDEEKVFNTNNLPDKSSIILRKVSYHLQSGTTKSLNAMLEIILQRGDIAGKEIAQQMMQELSGPKVAPSVDNSESDEEDDVGFSFSKYKDVSLAFSALTSRLQTKFKESHFLIVKSRCLSRARAGIMKDAIKETRDSNSLFQLLDENNMYCNWMNIKFLETIATAMTAASGNSKLERLIDNYKDTVYSRTLRQVWDDIPSYHQVRSRYYSELQTVFHNKDPDDVTVKEVLTKCKPQLVKSIALDIMEIGEGSLKIFWFIATDDVYEAFLCLLMVPQELRQDDFLQVGPWIVHHPRSVLLEQRKHYAMMSSPTLLVGYYYGLLLRDIDPDQLCDKMSTSGLVTAHHQLLIPAGCSVHQKKHLVLGAVRHMDDKSFTVFCRVLHELWPHIGTQLITALQLHASLVPTTSDPHDGDVTKFPPEHFSTTSVHVVFFHVVDQVRDLLQHCDQQLLLQQCREMKASDTNNISLFADDELEKHDIDSLLCCHCNWSDHSIIRELSSSVSEAVKLLDEFDYKLDCLQPIASYPIPHLSPDMIPTDPTSTHTVLAIRCDLELYNCTLQSVYDMRSLMVEKCDITLHSLQLLAVRPNPTIIYWTIPKCVVELISSRVPVHSDHLYSRGVLEVLVYPEPLLATSDDVRIGSLAFVADSTALEEELTTLLERRAEEKMKQLRIALNEKSKETEQYKLQLTQMQSENMVNTSNSDQKKLTSKVADLKLANDKVQKQNKQLEKINEQLQEKLSQLQTAEGVVGVEVKVKKLRAAWEGVRYNLQNIPLFASHMETGGSDESKHVDPFSEDSMYLSKLDNICHDMQAMKEWTTLFAESEKKKVSLQETFSSLEVKPGKEKTTVHRLDKDIEVVQTAEVKSVEKIHHLGTGRFGETSEAIFNNRKCTIKVLQKSLLDPSQSVRDIVTGMKKKCSQTFDLHHPNLLKLIDISDIDSRPAIITELMEINLSTYIRQKGGSVSLNQQVLLSLDMSRGLEALHRHSLIHGHLHDHNILIQGDQAKISDYYYPLLGLNDHLVGMKRALPYMAPEVTEDKSLLSVSSDVYSLGALILQVVSGVTPTEEDTTNLTDHVPQAHILSWLIQQCLNKDSGRRPSATLLCGEIERLQESAQYISSRAMMQAGPLPLFQTIKDGRHQFRWKDCSPLPAPLWGATAVVLGNVIYVSGGDSPDRSASHHVFAYHLLEDRWERLPALSHAHGVPVVVDSKLAIIGGKDTRRKRITNRVSTYNENTRKWESFYPNLREVRYAPLAIVYKHYVIVGGGKYHLLIDLLYDDIEVLDTHDEKLAWRKVPTRLPAKMWGSSATVSNDQLWIVGYNNDNSGSLNIIEQRTDETYWIDILGVLSSQKTEWTSLPRLSPYYSSTVVPNYYPIITVGGDTKDTRTVDAVLMFDSSSDSWNQVASLSGPPRGYTAVASLGEQQAIVVLGGCTETKNRKSRNESSVVLVQIGYAAEL